MILFWASGAALGALALFLLLRPLLARGGAAPVSRREANLALYRGQARELEADLAAGKLAPADYERSRAELEARLLEDVGEAPEAAPARRGGRGTALAVGVAVPLCALLVYFAVGSPRAIGPRADAAAVTDAQIAAMVERLAAKLREHPEDADGWKMLGRSYMVLGRFGEAVDAYAKAAMRQPRDAQLLADFAEALGMARGQSLQGEPEKLLLRALEIDPQNLKALALAGTVAFDRGEFKAAAAYWERMLPHVAPDSEDAQAIAENVAEAKKRAAQR